MQYIILVYKEYKAVLQENIMKASRGQMFIKKSPGMKSTREQKFNAYKPTVIQNICNFNNLYIDFIAAYEDTNEILAYIDNKNKCVNNDVFMCGYIIKINECLLCDGSSAEYSVDMVHAYICKLISRFVDMNILV